MNNFTCEFVRTEVNQVWVYFCNIIRVVDCNIILDKYDLICDYCICKVWPKTLKTH